jgi:hypothetical protein
MEMAGNANSGNRQGGKSITELVQRAAKRAIKQGEHGLGGQRALDDLLAETMQNDPLAFLKAIAPYVPREVVIDQTISISAALLEAQQRVIDMGNAQVIEHNQVGQLPSSIDTHLVVDQSAPLDVVTVQQGGRTGGVGAGS